MKSYQVIFFDRDGTLSRNAPQEAKERDQAIGKIIGREDFCLTPEMNMQIFWRVMKQPGIRPVNTLVREDAFWKKSMIAKKKLTEHENKASRHSTWIGSRHSQTSATE